MMISSIRCNPCIFFPRRMSKMRCSAESNRVAASAVPSAASSMISRAVVISVRMSYLSRTIRAYDSTLLMDGTICANCSRYVFPLASSNSRLSLSFSRTVTKSTGLPRVNISSIAP